MYISNRICCIFIHTRLEKIKTDVLTHSIDVHFYLKLHLLNILKHKKKIKYSIFKHAVPINGQRFIGGPMSLLNCYQPLRSARPVSKPGDHCEECGIHHASIPPLSVIVTSRSFLKGNGKYCNAFSGFVFFPTPLFLSLGCSLIVRGYGCLFERRFCNGHSGSSQQICMAREIVGVNTNVEEYTYISYGYAQTYTLGCILPEKIKKIRR